MHQLLIGQVHNGEIGKMPGTQLGLKALIDVPVCLELPDAASDPGGIELEVGALVHPIPDFTVAAREMEPVALVLVSERAVEVQAVQKLPPSGTHLVGQVLGRHIFTRQEDDRRRSRCHDFNDPIPELQTHVAVLNKFNDHPQLVRAPSQLEYLLIRFKAPWGSHDLWRPHTSVRISGFQRPLQSNCLHAAASRASIKKDEPVR
eukprot:CAMPEP_0179064876 /NCGR_PEP_ID=MMETSP0796-20121207/28168_1 /TAXON_ID=73915 /ORGANISM="Pyrodinium bahamense, Strain pbaha01" /LENGTH=203 /DNA_ID=CAMNT_0020761825 /DNA_START=319 /DNA_END=931 /DNA_ORIENTATION=+